MHVCKLPIETHQSAQLIWIYNYDQ
jgi:hypothetical protein